MENEIFKDILIAFSIQIYLPMLEHKTFILFNKVYNALFGIYPFL